MTKPVHRPYEISPAQCKAARSLLSWAQKDLAERAGIASHTVLKFENGENRPQAGTMAKLVACFQAAGIRFSDEAGVVGAAP